MTIERIDVLREFEQYRDATKTRNKEVASEIKKRIIRYVSELETENRRLTSENDPEALSIVHALGVTSANDEVRALKAQIEQLKNEQWAIYEKQISERIHELTVEAYDCIYEGEPPEEREVRWKWVMNGIQHMKLKLAEANAKLKEAKKNEAVCHCGAYVSEHTQADNHGAVDMEHPCPNEEKLRELGVHLSHCNFGEHAGTCKYCDDNCPALSEEWRWIGNAINRYSELRENLNELDEHSEKSLRDLCYKLIMENQQWRDRHIGTLMMLSYDGCISDGRAREIAGMKLHEWRDMFKLVIKELESKSE